MCDHLLDFFLVPKIYFHVYNSFKMILHIFILFYVFSLISGMLIRLFRKGIQHRQDLIWRRPWVYAALLQMLLIPYTARNSVQNPQLLLMHCCWQLLFLSCSLFNILSIKKIHRVFQNNIPSLICLRLKCSDKFKDCWKIITF